MSSQLEIRTILSQVRAHLKVIHAELDFFGGITLEHIYYSRKTKQVVFTDWSHSNFGYKTYHNRKMLNVAWPYNCMFRSHGEMDYKCFDELAIFCCYARFLNIQSTQP